MSTYRFTPAKTLLAAGSMTGTSVITSSAIDLQTMHYSGLYASWTGTPNGTFSVQGSLDGVNFADMGITVNAAIGAAGSRAIDIGPTAFGFIRLQYTNTSGTGTLTVVGSAKA